MACLTDYLDGYLARRMVSATPLLPQYIRLSRMATPEKQRQYCAGNNICIWGISGSGG